LTDADLLHHPVKDLLSVLSKVVFMTGVEYYSLECRLINQTKSTYMGILSSICTKSSTKLYKEQQYISRKRGEDREVFIRAELGIPC